MTAMAWTCFIAESADWCRTAAANAAAAGAEVGNRDGVAPPPPVQEKYLTQNSVGHNNGQ